MAGIHDTRLRVCGELHGSPAFAGMTLEVGFMVATAKKVGEGRYRESFGRAYEDFTVGDIYEHRPGRTITETDNTWFTLLTMNKHPLHFDQEYARHSEFRPLHRRLALHGGAAGRHERQ